MLYVRRETHPWRSPYEIRGPSNDERHCVSRHVILMFLLIFLVIAFLLVFSWVCGVDAALPEPAPCSPSPTATPTAGPQASSALVARALRSRRATARVLVRYRFVRRCFGLQTRLRLAGWPRRTAAAAVWLDRIQDWRAVREQLRDRIRGLRYRMTHPGGSSDGTRWIPLAKYVGWPPVTHSQLAAIIMRESSGRARAYNPSGATGLLQIMPMHVGCPSRLFDAEYNLTVGLRLYRSSGWQPWRL